MPFSSTILNQSQQSEESIFVNALLMNLGYTNTAKLMVYHEIGHFLDYLDFQKQQSNSLSISNHQNIDPILKNGSKHWAFTMFSGTSQKEYEIDELFKSMYRENIADCFACSLLFREQSANNPNLNNKDHFKEIVQSYIGSSYYNHKGQPSNNYASFNSLNQLYYNYKKSNKKPQSSQEWMDLIQESAQQGLTLNLEQIFKSRARENIKFSKQIMKYKKTSPRKKEKVIKRIQQRKFLTPVSKNYLNF